MDKTQAQAALEQVIGFLKRYREAHRLCDEPREEADFTDAICQLDQLSAFIRKQEKEQDNRERDYIEVIRGLNKEIAEQEKSVRVKVLEEALKEWRETSEDSFIGFVEQKISEANRE